jgi:DNA polymerase I-like protein with 3'-5' exonuclease and polymerase domains
MGKHHNVLASPFPNPGLIVLGLNNRRSAYSNHQELTKLGCSVELAWVKRLVAGYFSKLAGIFKWRQTIVGRAKSEKQVRTRIGRVIKIADDVTDNSLLNWPVQANGADGFKLALCLISRGLEGVDARIVHTQHDEIIIEARDAIEDQVREIVKKSMEAALGRMIPEVPFVAEIRVAEAWGWDNKNETQGRRILDV